MSDEVPSSTAPQTFMITNAASIEAMNRGPITKYFEPASTCQNVMSYDGNMYYGWGESGVVDTACYPMGTLKSLDIVDRTAWELFYYSPAVCPGGWETVTKFETGVPHENLETSFTLGSATTAALCCPSDFVYYTNGHVCTSEIRKGSTLEFVVPSTDIGGTLHIPTPTPSVYVSPSHAYANGIIIMWESSDVSLLRAATSDPNPSTKSIPKTSVSETGSPSASKSNSINSDLPLNTTTPPVTSQTPAAVAGLSTGAKVGLGIGIPLALFVGLALGWFLSRRRRPYGAVGDPPDYNERGSTKYAHTAVAPVELHAEPPEMGTGEQDKGHYHRHQLQ